MPSPKFQDTLTASPSGSDVEAVKVNVVCCEMPNDELTVAVMIGEWFVGVVGVEPPPELITRMLFEAPWHKSRPGWIPKIFNSELQPKFALSMAMTILSFSMLFGGIHQLRPADLEPTKVWAGIEDRAFRTWARTLKFYDNLKFVYQIQTTLREWQQDQEAQQPSDSEAPRSKPDEHRLPVRAPGEGAAPAPKPAGGTQ